MIPTEFRSYNQIIPTEFRSYKFVNVKVSNTLMTPTATVCLMSRTAKRPRGGNSWKDSTHIGLLGTRLTMAASPDLIDFGFSSVVLPAK